MPDTKSKKLNIRLKIRKYERYDLNLHASQHQGLDLACLPIPPLSQKRAGKQNRTVILRLEV